MAEYSGLLDNRTPVAASDNLLPTEGFGSGKPFAAYTDLMKLNPEDIAKLTGGLEWLSSPNASPRQKAAAQAYIAAQNPPQYRNPAVANALNSVLGTIGNQTVQPRVSPAIVRSQAVAKNLGGLYGGVSPTQTKETIADFTREYLKNKPKATQYSQEEQAAVGSFYGSGPGSVSGELNRLMAQRGAAVRGATQQALRRAGRDNSRLRMGQGNSSYADQIYANTLADIMAREAVSQADLGRENFLYTQQGQMANLGSRNKMIQDLLMRDLVPLETSQRLYGNDIGLTGSLANLEYANTPFDARTPEQIEAERLGLLGSLLDLEQRNRV